MDGGTTLIDFLKAMRLKPVIVMLAINLAIIFTTISAELISDFFKISIFSIFLFCYLIFGYAINSYGDFEEDLIAGKNKVKRVNKKFILSIIIVSGFISAYIVAFLLKNLVQLILLFLLYFLAISYSIKPLRFKTRNILGPLNSSLAQAPLPYILFVVIFYNSFNIYFMAVFFWVFLFMFILEISQQIIDLRNDRLSKTHTLAVRLGKKKMKSLLKTLLVVFLIYNVILLITYSSRLLMLLPLFIVPLVLCQYIQKAVGKI